ncbi:hypothetical protein CP8484711_1200A, partial [Chlamydia psittaci 84-8471/1]
MAAEPITIPATPKGILRA